ncbi:MAG: DUF3035 domain-containing protein [Acidisphaera sp.]|nr:DUF3035 domain-containing protein [Acidisphaera sp.]
MMSRTTIAIGRVRTTLALGCALTLAGCGGDPMRTFGLSRDAPDEFQVTTRAPLSMPPDFNLRPPTPGAPRPQEQSERRQAEAALAPQLELSGTASADSPGQDALVAAAGPAAPGDIRQRVDREASLDRPGESFTDRLMFWKPAPLPGTVVDPTREAQRLRENAALGRSVEAGDTPIIQRKSGGGFLGNIF